MTKKKKARENGTTRLSPLSTEGEELEGEDDDHHIQKASLKMCTLQNRNVHPLKPQEQQALR